ADADQDVDEDDGRAERAQRTLATELTDDGKPSKSPGGLGDLGGSFGGSADRHHSPGHGHPGCRQARTPTESCAAIIVMPDSNRVITGIVFSGRARRTSGRPGS